MKLQKTVATVCCIASLSACSILSPRNYPEGLGADCKDIECVIEAVDSIADMPEYGGTRWKFMEGYEDTNLMSMYKDGRLVIKEIPVVVPLTLLSVGIVLVDLAEIHPGKYGEVYKCGVAYVDMPNNYGLIHGLMHCQGYADYGIFTGSGSYTETQEKIMESEGKDSWVDTNFYKQKRYITSDYIANKGDK